MELSEEIQSLLQKYKPQATNKCDKILPSCNETDPSDFDDDIIDVDQIDMSNDELWLQDSEVSTYNLNTWLYNVDYMNESSTQQMIHEKSKLHNPKKNIDSRTFTRPKKKFTRPSIEKYNEDYFDGEKPSNNLSNEIENYISSCEESDPQKPLHFDLSQPTYSNFFDRILASAKDTDSFQNMSPPSLVNSMCSSTFANLMDNSLIRNDPVLREIRDADYSQEGMIFQETDAPLYQSFTESCSSINSDAPENFLRKTLPILNGTFCKNTSQDSFKMDDLDGLKIAKLNEEDCSGDRLTPPQDIHTENIDPNITVNLSNSTFNGTYRKGGSKFNSTYQKIDENINGTFNKDPIEDRKFLKTKENMNSTFQKISDNKERESLEMNKLNNTFLKNTVMNTTFHKAPDKILTNRPTLGRNNLDCTFDKIVYNENVLETEKKQVNDTINLKRLSLEIDDYLYEKINSTFEKARSRNSIQLSADSTDSLDRMSTASNSSRDSRNHMMAEVEAIVQEQERSLQVMSTPKPSKSLTKLFDNNYLSPIPNLNIKGNLSDSEISSEEYTTVRSAVSEKPTNLDRNVKSLSNLKHPFETSKQRTLNTMVVDSKLKGSYSNLRGTDSRIRGSYSNLKTFNTHLRSSYTNLKPFNSNLPNIPSKDSGNCAPMGSSKKTEVFKTPQLPKEPSNSANGTFVKPQSRISSLPRPVTSSTGIPRPLSKIPGPKATRSAPTRQIARPSSKVNVNEGYY